MRQSDRGRWLVCAGLVVGARLLLPGSAVQAGESRAKIAIATTLATAADHLRQHSFDGNSATYFESKEPIKSSDHFTWTFDAPVTVRALKLQTGRPDGSATLEAGSVELSEDGTKFDLVPLTPAGVVALDPSGRTIRSIRLRSTRDLDQPLTIREFTIESDQVEPFRYPVEFTINTEDAPELKTWTEETARLCEQWYDFLTDQLASENYKPTDRITLTMRKDYRGVAAAGGGRITGSVTYFDKHRDDRGAFIHETIHVIQNYKGRRNPGWLVEGVADYIRFFVFEPGKAGRVNPRTAKYDASYRTTAAFLDYLSRTHDQQIVKKLNKAMREGTYQQKTIEEMIGISLETLNDNWKASLPR